NLLSKDATIAVTTYAISQDGNLIAYALSDAGSDWQIWHVRDVATGKDLPDQLHWSKAGGASWRKDRSGFYYTAYDPPKPDEVLKVANQYEKLFFHKLGTPQSADMLIYTRRDAPDWYVGGSVTDDGRYLIVSASRGTDVQNTLMVRDLTVQNAPMLGIIKEPIASYGFIDNIGTTLYVLTDDHAPHYRIIAIDLGKPDPANWRLIVPEGADTLEDASLIGGQLIAQYMHDAHSVVRRYTTDGNLIGTVDLPGLGSTSGFEGTINDTVTYYGYNSYTTPT